MTDEEMAEERADKFTDINFNEPDNYGSEKEVGHFSYRAGFLAGLEAGKTKWHDLRKNPEDLPPYDKSTSSCIDVLSDGGFVCFYSDTDKCWYRHGCHISPPKAWCEIPKFEKEDPAWSRN